MILFVVPDHATAQNKPNSGDQQTERQLKFTGFVREVQLTPSGLVMTRFPVPESATAQNKLNSEAQQTDVQELSAALLLIVQVEAHAVAEA